MTLMELKETTRHRLNKNVINVFLQPAGNIQPAEPIPLKISTVHSSASSPSSPSSVHNSYYR